MDEALLETVLTKIFSFSGISVAAQQKPAVESFILQKSEERGCSPEEFCTSLQAGSADFDQLISTVTVNETYFFREEKQFDLLKESIFPKYIGKPLTLWTCSCATGEEAISLLALGLFMGIQMQVYASDIDTAALATLEQGRYSLYSLRKDGSKYHELLAPYSQQTESGLIFDRNFLQKIHTFRFNLQQDTEPPLPGKADIIFMRNVFIYFDKDTRARITAKMTERLCDGGLLFFSMNEIGSMDKSVCPAGLHKTNTGQVYYFVKADSAEVSRTVPPKNAAGNSGTSNSAIAAGKPTAPGSSTSTAGKPNVPGSSTIAAGKPAAPGSSTIAAGKPTAPGNSAIAAGKPAAPGSSTIAAGKPAAPGNSAVTAGKPNVPGSSAAAVGKPAAPGSSAVAGKTDKPAAAKASPTPADLKRTYEAVCAAINKGDFIAARTLARAISGSSYRKYSFFLQGYTEYYADNKAAAELLFASAETLSPDFWPAFFYHGLVLRDIGKEEKACACFRKCRELITAFGSSNPYDFTLDSFSPSYIYEACGTLQGEKQT